LPYETNIQKNAAYELEKLIQPKCSAPSLHNIFTNRQINRDDIDDSSTSLIVSVFIPQNISTIDDNLVISCGNYEIVSFLKANYSQINWLKSALIAGF